MRTKTGLIFLIVCLVVIACAGSYSEDDNGKTIELGEADSFQIKLVGEADSDYTWRYVSKNENVKMEGSPIVTVTGKEKDYTFNFKTFGYGEGIVALDYTNGIDTQKSFKIRAIIGVMGVITSE